jgi:hypothetical protein
VCSFIVQSYFDALKPPNKEGTTIESNLHFLRGIIPNIIILQTLPEDANNSPDIDGQQNYLHHQKAWNRVSVRVISSIVFRQYIFSSMFNYESILPFERVISCVVLTAILPV